MATTNITYNLPNDPLGTSVVGMGTVGPTDYTIRADWYDYNYKHQLKIHEHHNLTEDQLEQLHNEATRELKKMRVKSEEGKKTDLLSRLFFLQHNHPEKYKQAMDRLTTVRRAIDKVYDQSTSTSVYGVLIGDYSYLFYGFDQEHPIVFNESYKHVSSFQNIYEYVFGEPDGNLLKSPFSTIMSDYDNARNECLTRVNDNNVDRKIAEMRTQLAYISNVVKTQTEFLYQLTQHGINGVVSSYDAGLHEL